MTPTAVAIGLCAGSAVWLAARAASRVRVERMLAAGPGGSASSPPGPIGETARPLAVVWARTGLAWAAAGLVVGMLLAGPPGAVIGVLAGAGIGLGLDRRRHRRRRERLSDQLGDAVTTLAAASRAGMSLEQSVAYAGGELESPLGPTLQAVVERVELGQSLSASLEAWATAVGTGDARLVTGVLQLHRRTGGDLAMVLDQVADTIRERRAAEREIRSLTAQGRLSGIILGLLPFGFFAFLSVTAPQDMAIAYRSPAGVTAIAVGLVLELLAFVWIRRLLRVEV